jgi:hypothetical protein
MRKKEKKKQECIEKEAILRATKSERDNKVVPVKPKDKKNREGEIRKAKEGQTHAKVTT